MTSDRSRTGVPRGFVYPLLVLAAVLTAAHGRAQTHPLPSWNDTGPQKTILHFVKDTTTAGSPSFVAVDQRIATFGTPMLLTLRYLLETGNRNDLQGHTLIALLTYAIPGVK